MVNVGMLSGEQGGQSTDVVRGVQGGHSGDVVRGAQGGQSRDVVSTRWSKWGWCQKSTRWGCCQEHKMAKMGMSSEE